MVQGAAELDPQDVGKNTEKALALGNALLVCMAVPWALCVIMYSGKFPRGIKWKVLLVYSIRIGGRKSYHESVGDGAPSMEMHVQGFIGRIPGIRGVQWSWPRRSLLCTLR